MFKLLIMRVALVELGVWDCYLGVSLVVCVCVCICVRDFTAVTVYGLAKSRLMLITP